MTAPILDFGFWIGSPHGKIQNPKSKIQNQEVQNQKSPISALLLVGAVSLVVRLLLLWRYPFDGLYGQDAYFYLTATRDLVKTWTDPARLWNWLTVWGTPPISPWPLGYHLQMALVGTFT